MADKPLDPMEAWRNMLGEMEKGFNSFATQAMGSEQFSRAMSQMTGASAGAQKTVSDLMEKYLVSMNMPSRAQMVSFGERLQVIEGQLNEMRALLNRVHADILSSDPATATPKPARTKTPPSQTKAGGGA